MAHHSKTCHELNHCLRKNTKYVPPISCLDMCFLCHQKWWRWGPVTFPIIIYNSSISIFSSENNVLPTSFLHFKSLKLELWLVPDKGKYKLQIKVRLLKSWHYLGKRNTLGYMREYLLNRTHRSLSTTTSLLKQAVSHKRTLSTTIFSKVFFKWGRVQKPMPVILREQNMINLWLLEWKGLWTKGCGSL